MSNENKAEVLGLIGEWKKFAEDYERGEIDAVFGMAVIQNQLNVIFRKAFGYPAYDGKVVEDGQN